MSEYNKCCQSCKWADIAKDTRSIKLEHGTLTQVKGGVLCTNTTVGSITITDGEMKCSGYEEKENKNG